MTQDDDTHVDPLEPVRASTAPAPVRLLDGGAEAFPRMLDAIARSRQSVFLEVYAFELDDTGRRFLAALGGAAARGVRVRVILDGWGSMMGGGDVVAALRMSGCEATIFNPLGTLLRGRLRRDHRKLLLVDGEVAFVGGINIADEYATTDEQLGWADLAVELWGPVCAELKARLDGLATTRSPSPITIWLSEGHGPRTLLKRYMTTIQSAEHEVRIAHAYFLPGRRLTRALLAAVKRGVTVTLLLAGRSDVPMAHAATMRLYRQLLRGGVRIHEWHRSVFHAKVAVVDGRRMLVGSFNLDPLSLVNLEDLVEIDDTDVATAGQAWIDARIASSRTIRIDALHRSALHRWVLDRLGLWAVRATQWLAALLARRRRR